MFNKFLTQYGVTTQAESLMLGDIKFNLNSEDEIDVVALFSCFNGASFNDGELRIVDANNIRQWQENILKIFDIGVETTVPLAYDWLGRIFCFQVATPENPRHIKMYVPYSANSFEIPCSLEDFFNNVLINNREAAIEAALFSHFKKSLKFHSLPNNKCVGLIKPTFLGGDLSIENMEISDIEVYWDILGQIFGQIVERIKVSKR